MKIRLNCDAKVPYLHEKVIQDFSNVTIISEDNEHFQINPILLLSWIKIGGAYDLAKDDKTFSNQIIKVLDDHFMNDQDTVISSNLRRMDVTMVCEFLNRGSLPFHETAIINGVIPEEVVKLFSCFGIDLNFILKSFKLKSEQKELTSQHIKFEEESYGIIARNGSAVNMPKEQVTIQLADVLKCDSSSLNLSDVRKVCCSFCGDDFPSRGVLRTHNCGNTLEIENAKSLYWCEFCHNWFPSKNHIDLKSCMSYKPTKMKDFQNSLRSPALPSSNGENTFYLFKNQFCECSYCGKAFDRRHNLEDHVKAVHEKIKDIPCDFCDKTFSRSSDAKKHMKLSCKGKKSNEEAYLRYQERSRGGQSFPCNFCDKIFARKSDAKKHMTKWCKGNRLNKEAYLQHEEHYKSVQSGEENNIWVEDLSKSNTDTEEHLADSDMDVDESTYELVDNENPEENTVPELQNIRIDERNEIGKLQCSDCDRSFRKEHTLRYHEHDFRHGQDHRVPCEYCDLVFRNKMTLDLHFRKVHMKKKRDKLNGHFKCELCEEVFDSLGRIRMHHMQSHKGKKACPECGLEFTNFNQLRPHREFAHGIKSKTVEDYQEVICDDCGKTFANSRNLDMHKEDIHGIDEKIECDHCNKLFRNQEVLARHKKKTERIPCEICAEMISRSFMSSHVLTKHTDDKNMPFVCNTCGKGFPTRPRLDDHMVTHTGAKPYICNECGACFSTKSNLWGHKKGVHLGIKRGPRQKKETSNSKSIDALL